MLSNPPPDFDDQPIRFRVDGPLGKLVKWLRLLGFDTVWQPFSESALFTSTPPDADRIWITPAALTAPAEGVLAVSVGEPMDQLRQVIAALGIQRHALKPFSRCSECNRELVTVDREQARGRVPDYVWETHRQFRACESCRKIFWPGSHVENQQQTIERLFESPA